MSRPSDLAGLMAAVGVTKLGGLPFHVVKETEKNDRRQTSGATRACPLPRHAEEGHQDLGDTGRRSRVSHRRVCRHRRYYPDRKSFCLQVKSNGPDVQLMRYLHFHLLAE